MLRQCILFMAFSLWFHTAIAGSDTFSVFFRTNESILTDGMQWRIDDAIYKDAISDRDAAEVIGYADEVGGRRPNLQLSLARARAVKAYLVHSGFRPDRITLVV